MCTGSVRDNQFNLDGTFALNGSAAVAAPQAAACNQNDLSWLTSLLPANYTVTGNGNFAPVPFTTGLVLQPGEVVGLWFFFGDGAKWNRVVDTNLPGLGTTGTNNAFGDPTFSYVQQGYLRISAAMQATHVATPNWGNMRPFVATWSYSIHCPPPALPPPHPPLPPNICGSAYNITDPIPVGCPGGASGFTPSSIACPSQPGSAHGGFLMVRVWLPEHTYRLADAFLADRM